MTPAEDYATFLACLCVWRESRGETPKARRGVWHVLQNRVGQKLFRPTLIEVILQPFQFSSFNHGDANVVKFPTPANALDWLAWLEIVAMSEAPGDDPTDGAIYYESLDLSQLDAVRAKEPWFAADKLTTQLGAVRFYRA